MARPHRARISVRFTEIAEEPDFFVGTRNSLTAIIIPRICARLQNSFESVVQDNFESDRNQKPGKARVRIFCSPCEFFALSAKTCGANASFLQRIVKTCGQNASFLHRLCFFYRYDTAIVYP